MTKRELRMVENGEGSRAFGASPLDCKPPVMLKMNDGAVVIGCKVPDVLKKTDPSKQAPVNHNPPQTPKK